MRGGSERKHTHTSKSEKIKIKWEGREARSHIRRDRMKNGNKRTNTPWAVCTKVTQT
jgi:hypothetical protein